MKRQLCFKISAKMGNLKGQHYSRQEYIYICMCKVGTTIQNAREGKGNRKTERVRKSFIHI